MEIPEVLNGKSQDLIDLYSSIAQNSFVMRDHPDSKVGQELKELEQLGLIDREELEDDERVVFYAREQG